MKGKWKCGLKRLFVLILAAAIIGGVIETPAYAQEIGEMEADILGAGSQDKEEEEMNAGDQEEDQEEKPEYNPEESISDNAIIGEPSVSDNLNIEESLSDNDNDGLTEEEELTEITEDLSDLVFQAGGYGIETDEDLLGRDQINLFSASDVAGAKKALEAALRARQSSVDLSSYGISREQLPNIYSDVLNFNPELFYVESYCTYYIYGGIITTLYPQYSAKYNASSQAKYKKALDNAYKEAIPDAAGMTDLQKAMALHDYLVQHMVYDQSLKKYNAYNALVEGTAVCQGYTMAYAALLKKAGISFDFCASAAMNHIWNYVKIDGKWYHVDVTWDDPLNVTWDNDLSLGTTYHRNFLLSDAKISDSGSDRHYSWTKKQTCSSTLYDNAWWQDAQLGNGSAIFYIDGAEYYLKGRNSKQLIHRQNDVETPLYAVSSYYATATLSRYDGSLYFNDDTSVYKFNPTLNRLRRIYSYGNGDGLIKDSLACDGKIAISVVLSASNKLVYGYADLDMTAPVGSIQVGGRSWDTLQNSISFSRYKTSSSSATALITAQDEEGGSGIYSIEYVIVPGEVQYEDERALAGADLTWELYSDGMEITLPADEGSTFVLYARIMDQMDNVTYISSEGIVIDNRAPILTNAKEDPEQTTKERVFFSFDVDEGCRYYYTVRPADAAEPKNLEDILSGTCYRGQVTQESLVDGTRTVRRSTGGLEPNKPYIAYIVAEDLAQDFNDKDGQGNISSVIQIPFTTKQRESIMTAQEEQFLAAGEGNITEPTVVGTDGRKISGVFTYTFGERTYTSEELRQYLRGLAAGEMGEITCSFQPETSDYGKPENAVIRFEIVDSQVTSGDYTVVRIPDQTYTGSAVKPRPRVMDRNVSLTEKKDFTLSYSNNVKAGTGYVTIKGKGSYSKTMKVPFLITPKSLSDNDITLVCADKVYSPGKTQISYPAVKWEKKVLQRGRDYDVEFEGDQAEKGTIIVRVKGKGNYTGSAETTYRITDYNIAKAVADSIPAEFYDGTEHKPEVILYANRAAQKNDAIPPLTQGVDYEISYQDNIAAGTGKLIITGLGSYGGTKTIKFSIKKRNLSHEAVREAVKIEVKATEDDLVYTGNVLKPEVTVSDNGIPLMQGVDYTLSYSYNKNAVTDITKPNRYPVVTISGKGNYAGKMTKTFQILPMVIGTQGQSEEYVVVTVSDIKYNSGKQVKPSVRVQIQGESKVRTLKAGTDYTVEYKNNTECGEKEDSIPPTVIITGRGNYTGTVTATFRIYEKAMSSVVVDKLPAQTYLGDSQRASEPHPVVYANKNEQKRKNPLQEGRDYMLSWINNDKAGTGKVEITGLGTYGGTKTVSFSIGKRDLSETGITMSLLQESMAYTGGALKPEAVVSDNGTVLKLGVDYTVSYSNNKNAVTEATRPAKYPKVTVKGKGSYKGSISVDFAIKPKELATENGIEVSVKDIRYNRTKALGKTGMVPGVTVKDNGKVLKKGTHYTVEYSNNKELGEREDGDVAPTVTIRGKGNYAGTLNETFRIYDSEISQVTVTGAGPQTYTGVQVCPHPMVTIRISKKETKELMEGKDYTLSWTNNVKAGTAKVIITGKGQYGGVKTITFRIQPKPMPSGMTLTAGAFHCN